MHLDWNIVPGWSLAFALHVFGVDWIEFPFQE
jgi:hypothetical protein